MPQNLVDELNADSSTSKTIAKREVLLDALGNVPLKLYDVNFDNIDDIATSSWTPQMSLTDEERKVVEAKGTVLLLGRSGTGKTIVSSIICAQNQSVHKMCTNLLKGYHLVSFLCSHDVSMNVTWPPMFNNHPHSLFLLLIHYTTQPHSVYATASSMIDRD